jgi:hypothetical protein
MGFSAKELGNDYDSLEKPNRRRKHMPRGQILLQGVIYPYERRLVADIYR